MKLLTDEQVIDTHDDVEFIKRMHLWTFSPPTLPLVRRVGAGFEQPGSVSANNHYHAFMRAGTPRYRVFFGNIFAPTEGLEYLDFDCAEAIVAAGWRVD